MDKPKRQQRRYTNGERKACLNEFSATTAISGRDFCRRKNIAYSTWQDWQARLFHLMRWVKANKMAWLVQYLSSKTSDAVAYKSFRTLLLRFSYRHRFRHRIPCKRKVSQQVLDSVWLGYAATFWDKYAQYDKSRILNVDETAIFYDMPPGKTLAEIGMSSKVSDGEKHSDRLTTVLTWEKEQPEVRVVWKQEQADQRRREDEQRRQESLDREEREREARKREQQHEALMMTFMAKFIGSSNYKYKIRASQ
ncbi:hypothetical protein DYB28_000960 [Aphanomyces astaci]|uniref:DDE-1 domain-containing protein n=1 Tax=Aphanomyces astaci TaxID=112090 RepID=A0A9X8DY62_APHAT|nr:hypothetical protein DYB28_000960 [Aphanomyces astaci]